MSGRVQGVGFRYFAQDAAQREGLHGYVMNREDGTVEALAEGEAEAVAAAEAARLETEFDNDRLRVLIAQDGWVKP